MGRWIDVSWECHGLIMKQKQTLLIFPALKLSASTRIVIGFWWIVNPFWKLNLNFQTYFLWRIWIGMTSKKKGSSNRYFYNQTQSLWTFFSVLFPSCLLLDERYVLRHLSKIPSPEIPKLESELGKNKVILLFDLRSRLTPTHLIDNDDPGILASVIPSFEGKLRTQVINGN